MPSAHAGVSVRSMTLEQKVGQMFMLAFAGSTAQHAAALLRDHHVGACYLSNDNFIDPAQAAALATELQALARAASGIPAQRPSIPRGRGIPPSVPTAVWRA